MTLEIREALSLRQQILNKIPAFEIKPIFTRQHLNRELVGGFIGDRGGGKSAGCAVTGIVDGLMAGKAVFSNMRVSCDIEISDKLAQRYGLNYGGIAHYESLPLDKNALLRLDEQYRNSYIIIEEINVQYSNARRFITNTNIDFNEVCQQLRKFEACLLYNVIDEMFVDVQLRSLTDFYVTTYDKAFDLNSLSSRKPIGQDFEWTIYALSGYLGGEQQRYKITHKPYGKADFHFTGWHGVFNSMKHQQKGVYSLTTKEKRKMEAHIEVESDPENIENANRWSFLEDIVIQYANTGRQKIFAHELFDELNIDPDDEQLVDRYLIQTLHIRGAWNNGAKVYVFPDRVVTKLKLKKERQLVSAL